MGFARRPHRQSYLRHLCFSCVWPPCQLIYHPRKCERFGLSDGEGAERLWHSIQHLIAYTRIAGYHLRLYTLDAQFHFGNTESFLNIGKWIARKYRLLESKRTENKKELAESGVAVDHLREQWKDQVEKQTRPLPSQSKNKGKQAVQECMRLRKSKKTLEKRLKYLQDIISDPDTANYDVATAEIELPDILDRLEKTALNVKKKERALGANERTQLHHWVKSQYINKCMNARAILTRLRERLRSRKFELDRVERSCRKQRNEQRLHEHTEDSVRRRDPGIQQLAQKYNRIVKEMKDLIIVRKAPRNVVAPKPIDVSKLFNLDADDELWQDIGLNYDEADDEDAMPPPWLSDENVRKGIRAMLELDRCEEEEERLAFERKAMRSWFEEEWSIAVSAISTNDDPGFQHQLHLHHKYLCRLYVLWQDALKQFAKDWEQSWGPSEMDIEEARALEYSTSVEYVEEGGCDVSFERDVDAVLTEQLETFALAEEYRQAREDFITTDDFDVD
ncbi:hypothetical protein K435DRAFT_857890 [Dendrothele bispora CBS 962.96]|uniref:CxC1-like cysteine cluster associated with KDZ transposases domain-containing protein n=1 Tax=Dendrothele bispora (strain CBS 962.96) TaxID=1314807 RepID=A0A4S8M4G3_DENBC|nr:hypothetical protein K435DRAFT_857890 [Dendrothele bispora CBS 962.96]